MRRIVPLMLLAITVRAGLPLCLSAQTSDQSAPKCADLVKLPECSTERVNQKECRITVDRSYPVGLPTVQMKPKTKATVCVANPLAYETLTLDPASAAALAGADQVAGFFGSATMAAFGKIVVRNDPKYVEAKALVKGLITRANTTKPLEVDELQTMMDRAHCVIDTTIHQTATVYGQIQQAIAPPLPLPKSAPWNDYKTWRDNLLVELVGKNGEPDPAGGIQKWLNCDQSGTPPEGATGASIPPNQINNLLWTLKTLSTDWTCASTPAVWVNSVTVGTSAGDIVLGIVGNFTHFDPGMTTANFGKDITVKSVVVLDARDATVTITIASTAVAGMRSISVTTGTETATGKATVSSGSVSATPQPKVAPGTSCLLPNSDLIDEARFAHDIQNLRADQQYNGIADQFVAAENAFKAEIPGYYLKPLQNALADLSNTYLPNITYANPTSVGDQNVGDIVDPSSSSSVVASQTKFLGRTVSYSVNAVNQIGTSTTALPGSAKKAIATINILFADPRFEVSSGVFFSLMSSRTYTNQTIVSQTKTPGAPQIATQVVIAETASVPTVLPYVAANWRLKQFNTRRRVALYATAAIAVSLYNSSAEYAGGLSISWRSLMINFLGHAGREVNLTQAEHKDEVWCIYYPSGTTIPTGATPQCSGSPPSPSTQRSWTGAFALGIGIRIPITFGTAGGH